MSVAATETRQLSSRSSRAGGLEPSTLGIAHVCGGRSPRLAALASNGPFVSVLERAADEAEPDDVALARELVRHAPEGREVEAFETVLAVLAAARQGSTRAPVPAEDVERLRTLTPLVGSLGSNSPLVLEEAGAGAVLAMARWARVERGIAAALRERIEAAAGVDPGLRPRAEEALVRLRCSPLSGPQGPLVLTDEQERAVLAMATERTVVLTGGPGTGKTSVVASALRLRRWLGLDPSEVVLAAPTGKAADRLGEAVRNALASSFDPADVEFASRLSAPSTLHRLLGYRYFDGEFRAHRDNPLAQRFVLVDEVSMLDAALFGKLLDAVTPEASLVLVGDADQLPSVDPGAVLRDLLRARPRGVSFVELTHSHRMSPSDPDGAHVLSVARACREGPAAVETFRRGAMPVGRGGAWLVPPEGSSPTLDAWIARHRPDDEGQKALEAVSVDEIGPTRAPDEIGRALARLGRARVLAVTRRTATTIDRHFAVAVARRRAAAGCVSLARALDAARAGRPQPGEPVLVVRNDYDEDLWNGDFGIAFRDASGEDRVAFRRGSGLITRSLSSILHLVERAHAVTVHKAQGSEHDEVLFVLPTTDALHASRELVYTAVSRARRAVYVVAGNAALASALDRASERLTGLEHAVAALRRDWT